LGAIISPYSGSCCCWCCGLRNPEATDLKRHLWGYSVTHAVGYTLFHSIFYLFYYSFSYFFSHAFNFSHTYSNAFYITFSYTYAYFVILIHSITSLFPSMAVCRIIIGWKETRCCSWVY